MEGDALLIGIGTFGIGAAGFAAVAASLRTGSARWTPRQFLQTRAFRLRSGQVMLATGVLSVTLSLLNGFLFISVGVYALALCFQLATAAVSFYSLIADTT